MQLTQSYRIPALVPCSIHALKHNREAESESQNDSKNWIRFYGTTMTQKQATRNGPQLDYVYSFCAFK